MTDTPTDTAHARRQQVNFTVTDAEAQLLDAARLSWSEPGDLEPRTESRSRAAKRLVLEALRAAS